MTAITEQEAKWRLAGAGKGAGAFAATANSPNKETLDRIRSVSGAAPSATPLGSRPNAPAASPNAAVLQKIRTASGSPEVGLRVALDRARGGECPRDFIRQQGWVLIAWQNAFRHLALGTPVEAALVETVARGGDTDTNAAVCGALLGAAEGREGMPTRWTVPVLACRPARELGAPQPRPARYWPDDLAAIAEALVKRRMLLQ